MPNKTYGETIWLPKDSQIVEGSYQIRYGSSGSYSNEMNGSTLQTVHGFAITPSNYTYSINPETEYTDFLIQTGLNSVSYSDNSIIYIKFKVLYPNSKTVNVVFILNTGSAPA